MSTGKLVGLAVIIVAICPVIVGMVWPTGTETVDVWDVEPAIDITDKLANKDIRIWSDYTGPLNNITVYNGVTFTFPRPADVVDTPSAYPNASFHNLQPVEGNSIEFGSISGGIRTGFAGSNGTVDFNGQEYAYADYFPETNVLILYSSDNVPTTVTPQATDTISAEELIQVVFSPADGYVNQALGLLGTTTESIWVNGMINREVVIWVKPSQLPGSSAKIAGIAIVKSPDGTVTVNDGGGIGVEPGEPTGDIILGSAYDYIEIAITERSTRVTGLIGPRSFADTATAGNSVELGGRSVDSIPLSGTFTWWVKRTVSVIGTTTGIKDAIVTPDSYYPSHAWQLQIINPSTFGTALNIAGTSGSLSLPVSGSGTVTATSIADASETELPIRGLRILSLVSGSLQRIYLDGIPVMEDDLGTHSVAMKGEWYASVVMSKVDQGTDERYTWSIGAFGLDQTSYCVVGLLSCAAVAVGGVLWGRSRGSGSIALIAAMIVCGAAYYCMI